MEATINNENECNGSLSSDQKDTAIFVLSSVGLVSFISCVLIIILLFYLKLYKRFIYRLAMYQVISSMMVSAVIVSALSVISHVQEYNETLYDGVCVATAFLMEYIFWVKLLFTSSLTFHLFLMAVCLKEFKKLEMFHVLVSILLPLPISCIPFVGDHYGPAGTWCWITEKNTSCIHDNTMTDGAIEQLALWYVPCNVSLVLCIAATIVALVVLIWRGMKKGRGSADDETQLLLQSRNRHKKALLEVAPLLAYPAIFFIFNSIATINRIYNAVTEKPSFGLVISHSVTVGLWGICSSIALLVHIIVTRYLNKKHIKKSTERTAHTGEDKIGIYTSYDESIAITNFQIPQESEIDKLIETEN